MGLGLGKVGRGVEGRDAGGVAGASVAEGRAGGRQWRKWCAVVVVVRFRVCVCVCRCSLVLRVLMCWVVPFRSSKASKE